SPQAPAELTTSPTGGHPAVPAEVTTTPIGGATTRRTAPRKDLRRIDERAGGREVLQRAHLDQGRGLVRSDLDGSGRGEGGGLEHGQDQNLRGEFGQPELVKVARKSTAGPP